MIYIKRLLGKFDIILIIVLLLLAVAVSLFNYLQPFRMPEYALIYVDGELTQAQELTDEMNTINIKTYNSSLEVIVIEKKVFVESSSCTTKECIKKGKITKAGQTIYCSESRVLITITDENGLYEAQNE